MTIAIVVVAYLMSVGAAFFVIARYVSHEVVGWALVWPFFLVVYLSVCGWPRVRDFAKTLERPR